MSRFNPCEDIRQAIAELPGVGEVSAPEWVQKHLAVCPDCAQYMEEMSTLSAGLNSLMASAPSELYASVVTALPVKAGVFSWRLVFAVGILMAAIAAAAVSWYMTVGPGSESGLDGICVPGTSIPIPDLELSTEACPPTSQPTQEQWTPWL